MRKLAFSWLLFLLGVGACSMLHSGTESRFSRLLMEFRYSWMFSGYDVKNTVASGEPDARAISGQRKFTGMILPERPGEALSLDLVQKDALGGIVSKMEEFSLSIAKVESTAPSRNARLISIQYEDTMVRGVLVMSLQLDPDESAATFSVLIDEVLEPPVPPPAKRSK